MQVIDEKNYSTLKRSDAYRNYRQAAATSIALQYFENTEGYYNENRSFKLKDLWSSVSNFYDEKVLSFVDGFLEQIIGTDEQTTASSVPDTELPTSEGLDSIFSEIASLIPFDPNDEEYIPPTLYAVETTLDILFSIAANIALPHASVATDEGFIYLYWRKPSKKVHLAIPSSHDKSGYLYQREGEDYKVDYDVSSGRLLKLLKWYMASDK